MIVLTLRPSQWCLTNSGAPFSVETRVSSDGPCLSTDSRRLSLVSYGLNSTCPLEETSCAPTSGSQCGSHLDNSPERRSNNLLTLGRLAPGATVHGAETELRGVYADLVREYPQLRGDNVRGAPRCREIGAYPHPPPAPLP